MALEIAMQWTTRTPRASTPTRTSSNTHEGGTHEEGFRAALTTLVNKYAREKGLLKEKDENLSGDDVREGLTAVISVKLSEPQFEGSDEDQARQHRGQVVRAGASSATNSPTGSIATQPGAGRHPQGDPGGDRANRGAQGPRADATQGLLGAAGCPASSPTARAKTRRSARSSSSRVTRPVAPRRRAATPRRRRSCRCAARSSTSRKARLDRALANAEIQSMITAFGTGIGEDFDGSKARYHKVVLMADADVDGQHITTLLLTLLFRYMRRAHRARVRLPRAAAALSREVDETPTTSSPTRPASATRSSRRDSPRASDCRRTTRTRCSATRVSAR